MRYFRRQHADPQTISGVDVVIRYLGFPGWQVLPMKMDFDDPEVIADDPLVSVFCQQFDPKRKPQDGLFCDAYTLREDFFNLTANLEDWRDFLSEAGPMIRVEGHPPYPSGLLGCNLSLGDCVRWQAYFRSWQLDGYGSRAEVPYTEDHVEVEGVTGMLTWHVTPSTFWEDDRVNRGKATIFAFIECESVVEAIAATIQLDLLNGIRWRKCAKCKSVFEYTDRRKLFCSHECAHAAGQKRRRSIPRVPSAAIETEVQP